MTDEKYTAEQLEKMADALLEDAPAQDKPAQDKPAKGALDEKPSPRCRRRPC